jgi:hypothetical protein
LHPIGLHPTLPSLETTARQLQLGLLSRNDITLFSVSYAS